MWLGNGTTVAGGGGFVTGSLSTGSITISTASTGINTTIQSGSTFSITGGVNGFFVGAATITIVPNYTTSSNSLFSGFVSGSGICGNINGVPVFGLVTGSITVSSSIFILPCNTSYTLVNPIEIPFTTCNCGNIGNINSPYNALIDQWYTWIGGGSYDGGIWASQWNSISASYFTGSKGESFSAQIMSASFYSGVFSGSTFMAYYSNYGIKIALLTGTWLPETLYGASVTIPYPSVTDPYGTAWIDGIYVKGHALGYYTIYDNTSASFSGQFIDGQLIGGYLALQLSGSICTSSYSYTSSVTFTTAELSALNTGRPFALVIQNIRPEYKAGDIAKIGVFGRKQFPLKTFGISSQQEQYLVPEYLPTSSYYALKDNETGEIVMDFDAYTCLGCEYPGGNYFVLDTTGLPQERYYRVLIRVEDSGSSYTTDCGKVFKIVR